MKNIKRNWIIVSLIGVAAISLAWKMIDTERQARIDETDDRNYQLEMDILAISGPDAVRRLIVYSFLDCFDQEAGYDSREQLRWEAGEHARAFLNDRFNNWAVRTGIPSQEMPADLTAVFFEKRLMTTIKAARLMDTECRVTTQISHLIYPDNKTPLKDLVVKRGSDHSNAWPNSL